MIGLGNLQMGSKTMSSQKMGTMFHKWLSHYHKLRFRIDKVGSTLYIGIRIQGLRLLRDRKVKFDNQMVKHMGDTCRASYLLVGQSLMYRLERSWIRVFSGRRTPCLDGLIQQIELAGSPFRRFIGSFVEKRQNISSFLRNNEELRGGLASRKETE